MYRDKIVEYLPSGKCIETISTRSSRYACSASYSTTLFLLKIVECLPTASVSRQDCRVFAVRQVYRDNRTFHLVTAH